MLPNRMGHSYVSMTFGMLALRGGSNDQQRRGLQAHECCLHKGSRLGIGLLMRLMLMPAWCCR